MDGFRIRLSKKTNDIYWYGVDTGKTTLVSRNDKEGILAIHIAGHSYFEGVGQSRGYACAKFQVHKFESKGMIDKHYENLILYDVFGVLKFSTKLRKIG